MIEIIPAILTNDSGELEDKIKQAEGLVQRVQVDIIDGVFVNNRTVALESLEGIETKLLLDIHLMVHEPDSWVERAVRTLADRIIGQVEMMSDQVRFIGHVQETGSKIGLALDLLTPVSVIDPSILNNLDVVLVMSVKAGFGGQEFSKSALEKIKALDEIRSRDNTPFRICVDGGVNAQNIREVRRAGADEVAVGQSLFAGDLAENIERLKKTE
ncbi:MAG: ribulose-phosphate 3-epimerase [bacterium]|nr:ribulose-phosphate 3-epimerase [bacterium]